MKSIVLNAAKAVLNIIYIPMKCLRVQNKVVFLSRQHDYPNLDFVLLRQGVFEDR